MLRWLWVYHLSLLVPNVQVGYNMRLVQHVEGQVALSMVDIPMEGIRCALDPKKDPKLVFYFNPIVIGGKYENEYFDWIILSGRGGEILEGTERVCLLGQRSCPPPSTSQLTNQQFINCAFFENTSPCTPLCVPSLYPCLRVRSSTARPVYAIRVSLSRKTETCSLVFDTVRYCNNGER